MMMTIDDDDGVFSSVDLPLSWAGVEKANKMRFLAHVAETLKIHKDEMKARLAHMHHQEMQDVLKVRQSFIDTFKGVLSEAPEPGFVNSAVDEASNTLRTSFNKNSMKVLADRALEMVQGTALR